MAFFLSFFKGAPHKGTGSPAARPAAPYCVAHLNWLCLGGWLWLVEKGVVDWIVLYLVSQGATLRVQSVCIPRKAGDATAQQRPPACPPACLPRVLSLSRARSLSLTLFSAPLHTARPSSLFILPAKWSLSGLSIWLILQFCQLSCVKLDNLIWPGNRNRGLFSIWSYCIIVIA